MNKTLAIVLMVVGAFVYGCSSGGSNPLSVDEPRGDASAQSHFTWGLWQFTADPVKGTLDAVQLREGNMHLNALFFLEPPPLVNLTLESLQFNGNTIDAEIGLKHPFVGATQFTGFDVCGIFITSGTVTGFDDTDLRMAGDGDTRLLNPDGYSRWWNPSEFPTGFDRKLQFDC